eukprot:2386270-Pleurochrysis_carterae.AAC.2
MKWGLEGNRGTAEAGRARTASRGCVGRGSEIAASARRRELETLRRWPKEAARGGGWATREGDGGKSGKTGARAARGGATEGFRDELTGRSTDRMCRPLFCKIGWVKGIETRDSCRADAEHPSAHKRLRYRNVPVLMECRINQWKRRTLKFWTTADAYTMFESLEERRKLPPSPQARLKTQRRTR